jgi:hypothetical protein
VCHEWRPPHGGSAGGRAAAFARGTAGHQQAKQRELVARRITTGGREAAVARGAAGEQEVEWWRELAVEAGPRHGLAAARRISGRNQILSSQSSRNREPVSFLKRKNRTCIPVKPTDRRLLAGSVGEWYTDRFSYRAGPVTPKIAIYGPVYREMVNPVSSGPSQLSWPWARGWIRIMRENEGERKGKERNSRKKRRGK